MDKKGIEKHPQRCETINTILSEIEGGISAYEKEHEHKQVCDDCLGIYIPSNVVRRLIAVRKNRKCSVPQPAAGKAEHFILDVSLRAEIVETLRKAGRPCLAQQVLEETMPDYQQEDHSLIKECAEQRIAGAIAELERRKAESKVSDNALAAYDEITVYDEAISLLRGN